MFLGRNRTNLAIYVLAGIICIILLCMWALRADTQTSSKVKYVALLNGVNGKTLSEVEHKLDQVKVPYRIVRSSLQVPAEQVNKARIELAEAGLPKTGAIQKSR
ncbi:hypothetical protein [Alicyclobacillus acidiphilus]|uniref:hypothetical protein n=2 Tax=Alicyclobacillus acidiphilus TaxID=182455 RepID=UPI0008316937